MIGKHHSEVARLRAPAYRKGTWLIFQGRRRAYCGNACGVGRRQTQAQPAFSLLVNESVGAESIQSETRLNDRKSVASAMSGALRMARENPRPNPMLTPGRTDNRIRSPRCTASSR